MRRLPVEAAKAGTQRKPPEILCEKFPLQAEARRWLWEIPKD
jgi:hypothetical protein